MRVYEYILSPMTRANARIMEVYRKSGISDFEKFTESYIEEALQYAPSGGEYRDIQSYYFYETYFDLYKFILKCKAYIGNDETEFENFRGRMLEWGFEEEFIDEY